MASPKFYRLVERMRANASPGRQTIDELRANMEEVGRKFTPPEGVVFSAGRRVRGARRMGRTGGQQTPGR